MDDRKPTKYELRQLKKTTENQTKIKQKNKKIFLRCFLWLITAILITITFWQVDRFVKNREENNASILTSTSTILAIKSDDWIKGTTTAPVVLVEYSDFECPACSEYNSLLEKLYSDYGGQLAIVYRHYPWFFHKQALPAALAAEAAGEQGKFWSMSNLLFSKQADWSNQSGTEAFVGYAEQLGLDVQKFKISLTKDELRKKIENQLAEGKKIGIDYTPAFAIDGKIIVNPKSYEEFKQVIDQTIKSR